jgi:hypothetical protein
MVEEQKGPLKIEVKKSKIRFPEVCPVCLQQPEDLVFITIMENRNDDYASSNWIKQQDKSSDALNVAKGAATFAIPTCMKHGSKSVRSLKTKLIAALGFFVFFYPILFFLLQINVAVVYSRPLLQPLVGFLGTTGILIIMLLYGLFPRALERAIRFHDINRGRDIVVLSLSNTEYRRLFLALNEMAADIIENESSERFD